LERRISNQRHQAYKEKKMTNVQGFDSDSGKPQQTYEIATGKDDLRVQVVADSDMNAVSHANDYDLVHDGASGSVVPAKEL
jgi:hypothetical protein